MLQVVLAWKRERPCALQQRSRLHNLKISARACSAAALECCSAMQQLFGSKQSSMILGVVCSRHLGGHLRAEREQPVSNNLLPPLVQPSRIEVFEEQLVRDVHVVERAFAVVPVLREHLGVGKLLRDFPEARFVRLPLLALGGREVFWACGQHAQYRHAQTPVSPASGRLPRELPALRCPPADPGRDALQQPRSPDLSRRDALQHSRSGTSFAAATSRLAASSATVSSRPLCRLVCFSVVKLCLRPFLLCQNLVDEVGDIWIWVANPSPPKSETYNDVTIHR